MNALQSNASLTHTDRFNRETAGRKSSAPGMHDTDMLYHSLIEHLPVCVFRKDAAGRFIFVNSRFCRLKGLAAAEILGRTAGEIAHNESVDEGAKHHDLIMQSGRSIELVEQYQLPDGRIEYFQVVKSPVFGPDGKTIGTQGLLLDITERKQAEAQLAFERGLLRSLLDNSPDHVYFKDRDSKFIRASSELCERFGVSAEEIVGMSDFDFFQEEHARPAFEDEQDIIRTGRPIIGKVERETLKGMEGDFWVLTTKMPLRNENKEIIGTYGISKDITAIKQAETKLEQVHKQLLEASRMAGMAEVATSVLHNVGNVLNSVNISSSLISDRIKKSKVCNVAKVAALLQEHAGDLAGFFAKDPRRGQIPEYLADLATHLSREQEGILQELASLASNIEHIKEIVTMQQSYARVSGLVETLPPVELVEDALRMNAGAMERHHVQVRRDYSDTKPIMIEKHKALQILVNLIRNAKYALDDSRKEDKVMTLRVGSNGNGKVQISVIDNGVGIPAENLTRIFEHGFTTRKDGHGFGLHSGALVARELGGTLTVHSEGLGHGAAFTLELPCATKEGKGS